MRVARWIVAAMSLAVSASAQAPHEEWRTIETPHFRLHFPATHEEWAQQAAGKIEAIRTRVAEAVGYSSPQIIDVIIADPVAQPNGIAWPILGWPRMILWTNPPAPESIIGNYDDWAELLIVHEQTHLAHLLRPSRNSFRQFLSRFVPVSSIAFQSPRWVTEGYATVLEGELTGSGRPNGAVRAAILRRWAQLGRLPSYHQMSSDSRTWLGMSMAYLVGSAYLEWLQERSGPDSLQKLWRRMSSRVDRDFEEAFAGVFGETPAKLYARFSAELTARALSLEKEVEPIRNDGELWQDLSWTTEVPALSPDGTKLVTVVRDRERPSRIVVFSTAPPTEEEKRWRDRVNEIRERDPEDVVAIRTKPLARKPLHELETRNGAEPYRPKWLPDGSILFVRFEPTGEGFFRPDLFRWLPDRHRVVRVTHDASVRDGSPAPTGSWAAAVRNLHGKSQLVRVDLTNGSVSELTSAAVDRVYDSPTVSPDESRLAYVVHRDRQWRLIVRDLENGTEIEPPLGPTQIVAHPSWSRDGQELFAVLDWGGYPEIHSIDPSGRLQARRITQSHSGSFAPAPANDGSMYFLALDVDGFDIRYLKAGSKPPPDFISVGEVFPVDARAARDLPPAFESANVAQPRDYGFGRQELAVLFGGNYAPAAQNLEIGLRSGDVIGRLNAFVFGSFANERGVSGAAVAATWRGFPTAISTHIYSATEWIADQSENDRQGIELRTSWDRRWRGGRFDLSAGGLFEHIDDDESSIDRRLAFIEPSIRHRATFGLWSLGHMATARMQGGSTEESDWSRAGGRLDFIIAHDDQWLELSIEGESASDADTSIELLSIGGIRSTVLPDSATGERRFVPSLRTAFRRGDRRETQRVAARTLMLPMTLFYERHRIWMHDQGRGEWLPLVGAEIHLPMDATPMLRLPAAEIRAGVSRFLEDPLHGQTEWWLGLAWRP